MNDRLLRRYLLASLALTLAPSGCGVILGLGDFTEGSGSGTTGGGGTGGAGGVTGSSSGMETATSASSSVTTTSGSGGMTSSSSGTGGDATSSSSSASSSSGTGGGCVDGTMMPCYTGPANTAGVGACVGGTATCQNGVFGVCAGEVLPKPEVCGTVGDENCDGFGCSEAIWASIYGDANYQYFNDVAIDDQGNIFVVGTFTGALKFGNKNLVASMQDYFLVKFNSAGVAQWAKQFGDAGNNGSSARIAVDHAGSVIISGSLSGSADFGGGSLTSVGGSTDIFIAKFDTAGTYTWAKLMGTASNESPRALAIDAQNNVVIGGFFAGTTNLGGANFTAINGPPDAFLAKYAAANGAHLWSKQFAEAAAQTASTQIINDIAVDPAGAILVLGSFLKSANFGGGSLLATSGLVVAKYDAAGTHSWSIGFGNSSSLVPTAIAADSSGSAIITGTFDTPVDFGGGALINPGAIGNDIFVAKFDSTSAHKWSKRFGGVFSDFAADVAVDSGDHIILTGYSSGNPDFGGGALANMGGNDAFLAKLDTLGAHVWSKSFGDAMDQTGYVLAVDRTPAATSSDEIVLAAVTKGTTDFGTGALVSPGGMYGGAVLARFHP